MQRLSFILPCYNVERYIIDCLDSIYALEIPETEFEVICVNDCSTDGTNSLIEGYSKEHSNLVLINHTVNATSGGARNTGIRAANGEYIWFVDPDDMIIPTIVSSLLSKAVSERLDILFFNNQVVDEHLCGRSLQQLFSNTESLPGQDFVIKYFPGELSKLCIVWRCLFRRGFINQNKLQFPIMRKSQDVVFLWRAVFLSDRVASCPDNGYVYRRNPYSVANKRLNGKVLFSERMLFANEICSIINDKNVVLKEPIYNELNRTLEWCSNSMIPMLSQMDDSELSSFYFEAIDHRESVRRVRPFMNRKHKLLFSCLFNRELWMKIVRVLSKSHLGR